MENVKKNKFLSFISNVNFIKAIILIAIYFGAAYGLSELLVLIIKNTFSQEFIVKYVNYLEISINLIIDTIVLIVGLILYRKQISEQLIKSKNGSFKAILGGGLVLFYLVNFCTGLVVQSFETTTSQNQTAIESLMFSSKLGFILMFILVVFTGPIVEELVFRKAMFKISSNEWVCLGISSFVFGFIHVLSTPGHLGIKLLTSIPYIGSGFVFGFWYIKNDRNIIVTIALHMLSNLISVILIVLLTFGL